MMSRGEAAAVVRWAGALVALAAASALVLVLFVHTVEGRRHGVGVLALHAVFLLGCAVVLLSPAHRAVAELARRAAESARETRGARWLGFACIVFCAEAVSLEMVNGLLLLFLLFLAGVWTVFLSLLTGAASRPPPPPQGGEVNGTAAWAARVAA